MPRAQEIEGVRIRAVVDQYDLVGLAHQIVSDLLEDVLARNVDQVQLH